MKEKIVYNKVYDMAALMAYLDSEESVAVRNHIKETFSLDEMIELMLADEGIVTEDGEFQDDSIFQPTNCEIINIDPKHSLLNRLAARKPTH